MSAKRDYSLRAEEAMTDARDGVAEFIQKFGNNVSYASVPELRAFIRSGRMVHENCPGNVRWEMRPTYWPPGLLFSDPNNRKKNTSDLTDSSSRRMQKSDLIEIARFLVGRLVMPMLSTEVKTQEPESRSATSGPDSSEKYQDWGIEDQIIRIKNRLRSFFLKLDDQLRNELLAIVETWQQSEPGTRAGDLELLIDQLKMSQEKPERAEHFRKQLQVFAETETSAQSVLSATVNMPNCVEMPPGNPFDVDRCGNECVDEEKDETFLSDCRTTDLWNSTREESVNGDNSTQDVQDEKVELDLQEDVEPISSNSVEVLPGEDWFSAETVVDETSEEQTLDPGSHQEALKQFIKEGLEMSYIPEELPNTDYTDIDGVHGYKENFDTLKLDRQPDDVASRQLHMEGIKMSDVTEAPLNMAYKDIEGVRVRQENFDILRSDKRLDDVMIKAGLALMQRDYEDVDVFDILDYLERRNYNLLKPESDWKRWLLFPVLHDRHWLLLAADNYKKEFSILDSSPNEQLAEDLASWFRGLMSDCDKWQRIELPCGRQKDANSCGDFLLMNAEAFVNRFRRNITPDDFHHCLLSPFRVWISWKLVYADTSRTIFDHLSLDVKSDAKLCNVCQEMHKEVLLRPRESNRALVT